MGFERKAEKLIEIPDICLVETLSCVKSYRFELFISVWDIHYIASELHRDNRQRGTMRAHRVYSALLITGVFGTESSVGVESGHERNTQAFVPGCRMS
jgi:hypothetical protein